MGRAQTSKSGKPIIPAGTPIPCARPGAKALVGTVVPGRNGGTVKSCAAPPRAHPRRTDVLVVPEGRLLADGRAMPMTRAKRRIRMRAALIELVSLDAAYLHDTHESFRRTGVPAPSGLEFPHRAGSSPCDPQHPVWLGYEEAREAAAEEGAIRAAEYEEDSPEGDEAYVEGMRAALSKHASFAAWKSTAEHCARGFADRQEAKRAKHQSAASERAALRRRAANVGRDEDERAALGGYLSEKLDELSERKWRPKTTPKALRARAHPKAKKR